MCFGIWRTRHHYEKDCLCDSILGHDPILSDCFDFVGNLNPRAHPHPLCFIAGQLCCQFLCCVCMPARMPLRVLEHFDSLAAMAAACYTDFAFCYLYLPRHQLEANSMLLRASLPYRCALHALAVGLWWDGRATASFQEMGKHTDQWQANTKRPTTKY